MATKPKAILSTHDGREASPITRVSNVLFENGQTAQDILNDRQDAMISPVIENSSSMFKVGQGDNVDYSANVVNGAYESMVLKGKSMVNCIQEPSSQNVVLPYEFEDGQYVTINDTKESGALGIELKGQTLVNLSHTKDEVSSSVSVLTTIENITNVKPNTDYICFVNIKSSNPLSGITINQIFRVEMGTILGGVVGDIPTNYTTKYFIFNTGDRTSVNVVIRNAFTDASIGLTANTVHVKDVMILEYQEGMKNWDIPYFTGMTSCKMPILKTVGKNLLNDNTSVSGWIMEDGRTTIRGALGSGSDYLSDFIYVGNINQIKINRGCYVTTFDENKKIISQFVNVVDANVSNCSYIRIAVSCNAQVALGLVGTIQVEEGSVATSYEPYKSSILSLPEEVVLRSLPNGVCDTFNTKTGEYVQRIGEITLDGNTRHTFNNNNSDNVNVFYFDNIVPNKKFTGYAQESQRLIQCDSLKTGLNFNRWDSTESEYSLANTATGFWIFVPKSIPQSWLAQNPVAVQYELAEPIVTKINLPSTLKSWNTTTHIYSEIPENTLYPILSHSNPTYPVILKPSTKYSIVANSYSNNHTNSAIKFNLGGATASTTVGNRVTTVTTPSTLSNELLTMSGRGNKLNNVMVIEGDVVGDEPYFEGICDCKSPILRNTGLTLYESPFEKVYGEGASREFFNMMDLAPYVDKWGVNKNYTFSFDIKANKSGAAQIYFQNGSGSRHDFRFTVPVTTEYVRHTVTTRINGTDYNWKESKFACFTTYDTGCFATIKNIQFALGTSVEPYQSNITTFDQKDGKTIVLRSLPNGVKDELNLLTGEYIQRVGEVILNGKNNQFIEALREQKGDYLKFGMQLNPVAPYNHNVYLLNDRFNSETYSTSKEGQQEQIYIHTHSSTNTELRVCILPSKLSTPDNVGFNSYLQSNPITVQYELATPIVSTIDVQGFPYAYTNGHVQLSSGSIEQSLTPTVEYSVATNRNGQIRSNQKMVERHQKQLDQLQAIILANLVNSQYNQTLTTLKYELSRV